MKKKREHALEFGSEVYEKLMPFRRPFRFIDRVVAYRDGDKPELWAFRNISANESVFDGHFPGQELWPGSLIMEGLGQTVGTLAMIYSLQRGWQASGNDPAEVLDWIRNMELGVRAHPGHRAKGNPELESWLATAERKLYVTAAVEMKFLKRVVPGDRLDYHSQLTHVVGTAAKNTVTAHVGSDIVATGTMTGAMPHSIPTI